MNYPFGKNLTCTVIKTSICFVEVTHYFNSNKLKLDAYIVFACLRTSGSCKYHKQLYSQVDIFVEIILTTYKMIR